MLVHHIAAYDGTQILCISDCTKRETRTFFDERLVPIVPEDLKENFVEEFEYMYEAFGGRLVHWNDYVGDYGTHMFTLNVMGPMLKWHLLLVNSDGALPSSYFL